jgi:hypothetical protein
MRPVIALGFVTNVWINWAWIALDHRDEARAARERDGQPTNNPELAASMIAIVGAAFAIDGFASVVRTYGREPEFVVGADPPPRAAVIWETFRANFDVSSRTNTWPGELKRLWQLRSSRVDGGLVHPKLIHGDPVPLPETPPSWARETYTVETATWANELMADVVVSCGLDALKPGLDELRRWLFDYAPFAAEFAARTTKP